MHDIAHTRQDWIYTKLRDPRVFDKDKEAVKDYNELLKMPNFGMSEREAEERARAMELLAEVAGVPVDRLMDLLPSAGPAVALNEK